MSRGSERDSTMTPLIWGIPRHFASPASVNWIENTASVNSGERRTVTCWQPWAVSSSNNNSQLTARKETQKAMLVWGEEPEKTKADYKWWGLVGALRHSWEPLGLPMKFGNIPPKNEPPWEIFKNKNIFLTSSFSFRHTPSTMRWTKIFIILWYVWAGRSFFIEKKWN